MKRTCKQFLSIAVALILVLSMIPAPAITAASTSLSLTYDDRLAITELRSLGYEITTVGGLVEAQGVEPYTGEYIDNVAKAQ